MIAALALLSGACSGGNAEKPTEAQPSTTGGPASTIPPPVGGSTSPSAPTSSTTAADSVLTPSSRLRLDGIGPVKVGMTLAEASKALGKPLRFEADPELPSSCGWADPPGVPDVHFMVIDGRVRRVDVYGGAVATVSGVQVGNPESEVDRIYGGRVRRAKPFPEAPGGYRLVYESPEASQRAYLLIFETDGSKVISFRAGEREAVELVEGCL